MRTSLALVLTGISLLGAATARAQPACAWRLVAHAGVPTLWSISAVADDDVWAIGGPEHGTPALAHWDGHRLRVTRLWWPDAVLTSVAATAPDDAWAVGFSGATAAPLAVHWDGRAWRRVSVPARGGFLSDVAGVGPHDVWAVGGTADRRPLLLHWDGSRWRRFAGPQGTDLLTVAARSAHDVWAAGRRNLGASSPARWGDYVVHWDGRSWSRVDSPAPPEGPFPEASAVAADGGAWTLDYDASDLGPVLVHWAADGSTSAREPRVSPEWALYDLAAAAAGVWVVGATGDGTTLPLVARGDGATLRKARTPFDHLAGTDLAALDLVTPTDVWAAGNHLLARYSCAAKAS